MGVVTTATTAAENSRCPVVGGGHGDERARGDGAASAPRSPKGLWEKVAKIGAKLVAHGFYLAFQMAEVAVPQELFGRLLDRIARLRPAAVARC